VNGPDGKPLPPTVLGIFRKAAGFWRCVKRQPSLLIVIAYLVLFALVQVLVSSFNLYQVM